MVHCPVRPLNPFILAYICGIDIVDVLMSYFLTTSTLHGTLEQSNKEDLLVLFYVDDFPVPLR